MKCRGGFDTVWVDHGKGQWLTPAQTSSVNRLFAGNRAHDGEVPAGAGAYQSGNKKRVPGRSPAGADCAVAMATGGGEHLGRGLWGQARAVKAKLLEGPGLWDRSIGTEQQRGRSGSFHKALKK